MVQTSDHAELFWLWTKVRWGKKFGLNKLSLNLKVVLPFELWLKTSYNGGGVFGFKQIYYKPKYAKKLKS